MLYSTSHRGGHCVARLDFQALAHTDTWRFSFLADATTQLSHVIADELSWT